MALVGEAVLSAFIETLFDKLASSDLLQFARQEEVLADINKWEKTLLKLHAVLGDAEEKQLTSRLVKLWLDDLRDLAYDVEDILDEFATEALGRKLMMAKTQPSSSSSSKLRSLIIPSSCCTTIFSTPTAIKFNMKMRSKIEKITSRLQDITSQKNDLDLAEDKAAGRGRPIKPTRDVEILPTTCSVEESRVCGRETEKAAILKLLLDGDHDEPIINRDDFGAVRVIAIYGMGGLGKTTLAQLAYNDDKVQPHFNPKIWVCVSDNFDVLKVTKTILQSITSSGVSDVNDLNQLQLKLKEELSGKKFLLVLDDVWNENRRVWETFYHPIMSGGAQGSRVIVTTRNQGVVSAIGACSAYPLKQLPNDECLSLLAQQAFGTRNFDNHPDLRVVGEEIAKRCKGLPLAATTLGGMLSTTQNPDEWEHILKSKIWELPDQENNDILPALRLSYHHLPSHLKRCFAYCSIFPKDYEFQVDELVLLWMGEGFLDKVSGRKQMEKIGTEYFHQLLARSLFQQSDRTSSVFVMHDLVHDLAQFVAGDTCFNLEDKVENNEQPHTISKRARHSSFIRQEYALAGKFEAFGEVKTNLRTLIALPKNIRYAWDQSYISQKVLHELVTGMGCLRVLSLAGYHIREVPDFIGNLKHLRYLNFSKCGIERLPDSVSQLYNLQTLILRSCRHLVSLPSGIGKLINLRHLDFSMCSIESLPDSVGDLYNLQTLILLDCRHLVSLPSGIGKLINLRHLDITGTWKLQEMPFQVVNLTNLQTLSRFIVGNSGRPGIGEVKNLSDLQGVLSISKLHEIGKVEDACDANLKNKQKLKELIMEWGDELWDSRNDVDELQVLESLRPHENLERLTVEFYGGSKFPDWIGDLSLSKMVRLTLRHCTNCTSLPSLGRLPLLEVLYIEGMGKVESIGAEFYGECSNPFASLKELRFEDMPEWERWSHDSNLIKDNIRAFPTLEKFMIRKCPKLMGELPKWLHSLKELEVSECPKLMCGLPPKLASLDELNLQACDEAMLRGRGGDEEEVDLSSLATLRLEKISRLNCLRKGHTRSMVALKKLVIRDCGELTCLWEEEDGQQGVLFSNLKILRIENCSELKKLPNGLHINVMSLEELEIWRCPKLESFPETGLPPMLRHLEVRDCANLKALPLLPPHDYNSVCALESLVISNCGSLKSFATTATAAAAGGEELVLPSTLKQLQISHCPNLDPMCPDNNTALEHLSVEDYPNLRTLPLPECLNSLKVLSIGNFKGLECFPARGLSTPNLIALLIDGCQNLKSLSHQIGILKSLTYLMISHCPGLESFPEGGLAPNLTSLYVDSCDNLETPISKWGLKCLTSLCHLTITNMFPHMVSFPDDKCTLPISLTCLEVGGMESLTSLPLQNLTSLQFLKISKCPKLRSLGSLPSTLERLKIVDCPIIKKRCLKGKGECFANIPCIWIDKKHIYGGLEYNL